MAKKVVDKKQAVLNAALSLIAEHGFHAAPMSRIAKRAQVATGTIYHYFSSKDDMVVALYLQLKQRLGTALMQRDDPQAPYKTRFFTIWTNLFDFYVEHPDLFRFLQQFDSAPIISAEARAKGQAQYQETTDFLSEGIRLGVLRDIPPRMMIALLAGTAAAAAKLHLSGELALTGSTLQAAVTSAWNSMQAS